MTFAVSSGYSTPVRVCSSGDQAKAQSSGPVTNNAKPALDPLILPKDSGSAQCVPELAANLGFVCKGIGGIARLQHVLQAGLD